MNECNFLSLTPNLQSLATNCNGSIIRNNEEDIYSNLRLVPQLKEVSVEGQIMDNDTNRMFFLKLANYCPQVKSLSFSQMLASTAKGLLSKNKDYWELTLTTFKYIGRFPLKEDVFELSRFKNLRIFHLEWIIIDGESIANLVARCKSLVELCLLECSV